MGGTPRPQSGHWRKPFDSGGLFEPLQLETFSHTQEVTRADAVDVFASRSYVASLPEDERTRLLERVAEQVPQDRDGRDPVHHRAVLDAQIHVG